MATAHRCTRSTALTLHLDRSILLIISLILLIVRLLVRFVVRLDADFAIGSAGQHTIALPLLHTQQHAETPFTRQTASQLTFHICTHTTVTIVHVDTRSGRRIGASSHNEHGPDDSGNIQQQSQHTIVAGGNGSGEQCGNGHVDQRLRER